MRRGGRECAAGTEGKSRRGHGRRSRLGRGRVGRAAAPGRFAFMGRAPGPLLTLLWGARTPGSGGSEERDADRAEPQQRSGGGGFGERKVFDRGRNSGRVPRAWISILSDRSRGRL